MPHRSTGHGRNRIDGPEDGSAADAGALNTLPDNDSAPYVFVAVAVLHALLRGTPAALDVDGTAPHVVAAD